VLEGDEARDAVARGARATVARRDLARRSRFEELSPEVGDLDVEAVEAALEEAPDETLELLAEMTGATDERLRGLARSLAGRVLVEVARTGVHGRPGVGRLRAATGSGEGDLDLDASLESIAGARASRRPPSVEDLVHRRWERHDTAVCLVVDRSGSMSGRRLATAALAAAAVVLRYGAAASVVAFSDEAVVLAGASSTDADGPGRPAEDVVDDLLRLRGSGTTDVGLGLRAAVAQLRRTDAARRVVVLLSDCRSNVGDEVVPAAAVAMGEVELAVIAPADDDADARDLAAAVGCRLATIAGPSDAPAAIATAVSPG